MSESVFIRRADPSKGCEVHDWPTEGMAPRLVTAMRLKHGKGGVNVCVDCIARAKHDAGVRAGLVDVCSKLNAEQRGRT